MSNKNTLKWKFDISTFRLLGRELITDRITALFELVKNSYDANATSVTVEFWNINPLTENSKIVIRDNGTGMTKKDIQEKWMVIGSSSKRKERISAAPYNRKLVGKKGVGRFAVDKLGSKFLMKTSNKHDKKIHYFEVDWRLYEKIEKQQLSLFDKVDEEKNILFTDIENNYWETDKTEDGFYGTSIIISPVRDTWTQDDIKRAYSELSKLVSPTKQFNPPFNISIFSNDYEGYDNKSVKSSAIENATEKIELTFDLQSNEQEILSIEDGRLSIAKEKINSFGPIKLTWYFFDKAAKAKFRKESLSRLDGIKIYRDGLIATPFAEYVADRNKQKDLLGLDKRRWSGFFDKVGSRDIIGYIDISDSLNPNIKDATNRQGFVDTKEFDDFLKFFISQIETFEDYLSIKKKKNREEIKIKFGEVSEDLNKFSKIVKELKKDIPIEFKEKFNQLEVQAKEFDVSIKKGFNEFKEIEKEKIRQENLFFSLMSLQEYAAEMAHLVKTALGRIIRLSYFFKEKFPNSKYDHVFIDYSKEIYHEAIMLNKAVEFMLSYSKSNIDFEEVNLYQLIQSIFDRYYNASLENEDINFLIELDDKFLITHNKKFIEDIFSNLIDNSIKALKERSENKEIRVTGQNLSNKLVIYFSDNGVGIPKKNWNRIFDVYFTTTAEQGGAGIGLFTASKRIEALKGKIEVVENQLKPTGATFKIEIPFK